MNKTHNKTYDCPGCGGRGFRSAMSGGHIPYDCVCSDCDGRGLVTEQREEEIKKREEEWLRSRSN